MLSMIESAVASSRTSPNTPDMRLQERVDLAGRVAEDRIAQSGQEAEVVRGRVELLELIEVVHRMDGFLEERRECVQYLHVQLAGRRLLSVPPGSQLPVKPSAEPRFVEHFEAVPAGLIVGIATVHRHVPIGQRAVIGGAELIGRADRLEQADGGGDPARFRFEIAEGQSPAVSVVVGRDPGLEPLGQFLRSISATRN